MDTCKFFSGIIGDLGVVGVVAGVVDLIGGRARDKGGRARLRVGGARDMGSLAFSAPSCA